MPTTTIEAVYEQGVLRLSRPIDLAEGTRECHRDPSGIVPESDQTHPR